MKVLDKKKIIRITTVPTSLLILLKGQLRFMKKHYEVAAVSSGPQSTLKAVSTQENVDTILITMTRVINPIQDLKATWKLYRLFKKEKPFIVHTHTPKAGTLGMLAAMLAGVPHRLHTVAGLPLLQISGKKRILLNVVEKVTYFCATHIYPNSFGLKEIIIQEKFCNPTKLKVLANGSSNGIDINYFNPEKYTSQQIQNLKNYLGIDPNDFVFIFVGRLVSDKGINELIQAFKFLSSKIVHIKLLLVGSYESKLDPLNQFTLEEIEDNDAIISVGFKIDVRPYLIISDSLVFPSYREGFPNVVMQAGAMGLPSIVTNINGCNEIIVENQNGLIIPKKDVNALINAMMEILKNVDLRNKLQKNSRSMIVSRYNQKLIWEAILDEYKMLEVPISVDNVKIKLIRTSTIASSLDLLLKGQLSFLNQHFEVIAISGKGDNLNIVENREGIKTIAVTIQRKISPLKDIVSLVKLYRVFKKEKPEIVHSITPKAGLLSMAAAYFAGVPIRMHTFTGLIFPTRTGIMKKVLIVMDKLLCKFATDIYPEGEGVKKDLKEYGITKKPLQVLANGNVNGIDINYFNSKNFTTQQNEELKNRLGILAEDFVFIFLGRLVGDKGINELVKAFVMQNQSIVANSKLILVGPLETNLDPLHKDTLKEIEENPNIITVGFQKDVRPFLAISNCLAFPSYREGFPNVVMQAGAMGLPSIVTNINGCNEIIVEGQNGTIIPVKDTYALYHTMKKMASDVNYCKKLQQNTRPMIVSRFEQHVVWEAILEEYNRLLTKEPVHK